jgi:hypothetical protein|uniref:Uncharacterized protein n=1 Tax=Picea glauca TaxID=3330 RepID=A0A117NHH9_PICGL|nr:hypothetical protein ABT39_MTgene5413 [Picea glauca]QHR90600.1 hypothetical protein Q903MT_gene4625 [Picea sitchensis]
MAPLLGWILARVLAFERTLLLGLGIGCGSTIIELNK